MLPLSPAGASVIVIWGINMRNVTASSVMAIAAYLKPISPVALYALYASHERVASDKIPGV